MLKDQIKTALRTEYANLGLGDPDFENVAAYIEKSVTKEEDIATAVKRDDVATMCKAIQSATDGMRKAKLNAERELNEYKKNHPEKQTEPEPQKDPKPSEPKPQNDDLKAILDEVKELKASIAADKQKAEAERRLASAKAALKGRGCSNENILDLVMEKAVIGESETDDDFIQRCSDEYGRQYKRFYGDGPMPPIGGNAPAGNVKAEDEAFKAKMVKEGLLPDTSSK